MPIAVAFDLVQIPEHGSIRMLDSQMPKDTFNGGGRHASELADLSQIDA
jgi:hypothetical protein